METKALLYGIIGFMLGGLLVSVAATTFDKPETGSSDVSMAQMSDTLRDKRGDDFDQAFIEMMIEHHQGAVDMAKLAEANAKHGEIKTLSTNIIQTQQSEIIDMKTWQAKWQYEPDSSTNEMGH